MDLIKKLKYYPKGSKLYSPMYGYVTFDHVDDDFIHVKVGDENSNHTVGFYPDGRINKGYSDSEITLFPSKGNRDWNTFLSNRNITTLGELYPNTKSFSTIEKILYLINNFYSGVGDYSIVYSITMKIFYASKNSLVIASPICFKSEADAKEFLSYEDNVEALKQVYNICN